MKKIDDDDYGGPYFAYDPIAQAFTDGNGTYWRIEKREYHPVGSDMKLNLVHPTGAIVMETFRRCSKELAIKRE